MKEYRRDSTSMYTDAHSKRLNTSSGRNVYENVCGGYQCVCLPRVCVCHTPFSRGILILPKSGVVMRPETRHDGEFLE